MWSSMSSNSPKPPREVSPNYQAASARKRAYGSPGSVQACSGPVVSVATPRLSIFGKLSYGVGHIFNDLCASMWFTYLVLFFHKVIELGNTYAGLLILIGQLADAAATPIIGFLCDKTHVRYGRRKLWHLIGTVMVAVSLFFIWHSCLGCESSHLAIKIVYFSVPIIVFQFGWASVQISHLSLIPELTSDRNQRVGLNAIRYSFTILSNIGVYVAMFLLLMFVHVSDPNHPTVHNSTSYNISNKTINTEINPGDVWIFSGTALGIIAVGLFFSGIFQIGTREPYITEDERKTQYSEGRKIKWYLWFTKPQFYMVATIYMCTRLMNNIIQAYTPLFLTETLFLTRTSVAIGPLVIFVSGFLTTLLLKLLNRVVGRYMVYFLGIALMWAGLLWFQALDPPGDSIGKNIMVYCPTILVGAGGATVLVTSLSMVADLIDNATGSAAFVYGLMSFTDKLSSGAVIQLIQALHPCKGEYEEACCSKCAPYYRTVLVLVPGAATAVAVLALALLTLWILLIQMRTNKQADQIPEATAASINPRQSSPLRPPIVDSDEKDPLLSYSHSETQ